MLVLLPPRAPGEVALISGHPTMSGRNRLLEEKSLSIKPGNPTPELHAEFSVTEEEPDGPWVGLAIRPDQHTPTVASTPHLKGLLLFQRPPIGKA